MDNNTVSINPKYQKIINSLLPEEKDRFMYMVDNSHFAATDTYNNYFFPSSTGYRQKYRTAKEISDFVDKPISANSLLKLARKGLVEVKKETRVNTYCLPYDFFITNDLKIRFCGKQLEWTDF